MAVIVGVDPASTKLAMVARSTFGSSYISSKVSNLSGGKKRSPWSPMACGEAAKVTASFVEQLKVQWANEAIHAFIESPLVGKGGVRSTMVQAFTSGALQATMVNAGCTVTMVNVSTWKKEAIGSGHASKDDVAEGVRLRWPAFIRGAGSDQDLIDAAAIALWGQDNLPE